MVGWLFGTIRCGSDLSVFLLNTGAWAIVPQIGSVCCFWPLWNAESAGARTREEGAVQHPCLVLNRTEERPSLCPVWLGQLPACCCFSSLEGYVWDFLGWGSVFRVKIPHTDCLLCLASLCSALKLSMGAAWLPYEVTVLFFNWLVGTADAGLQWNTCHCRTFNTTYDMLILKERSGSVRFCGSSFLHVWRTQRYQGGLFIYPVPGVGGWWVLVSFLPQVRTTDCFLNMI